MALAIMAVPMIIAAGAAVDFSRIASARALLQASVDSAAIAGVGAWQTSASSANAQSVAEAAWAGSTAQLSNVVTVTSGPVVPNLACTGTTAQCNTTGSSVTYSTAIAPYGCPASYKYCVSVTASASLKNSLFAYVTPSEALTVTGVATSSFPAETISGKNIPPSPGFGSAGDVSGIYAYAVPMSGSGSNATPEYNQMPQPNSACTGYKSIGPLALENAGTGASTACNYLFIALSTSSGTAGSGGSITLAQNQPIAFSFVNYTGANGYHSQNYYQTSTNLMVYKNGSTSGAYEASGLSIPTYYTTTSYACTMTLDQYYYGNNCPTTGASTTQTSSYGTNGTNTSCQYQNNYGSINTNIEPTSYNLFAYGGGGNTNLNCTTTVTVESDTALSGQCPASTLYGSLDPVSVNTTTGANNVGIPVADSLNTYSSAYEVLGYPPTYKTNRALIPFVAPSSLATYITDIYGNSYTVRAVCPNYDRSSTTISAPISTSYANLTGWSGLNIYSTAFPGQTFSDSTTAPAQDTSDLYNKSGYVSMTTGSNDIFPPSIAGCTPTISSEDGGVTSSSLGNWWNWHSSNYGNCGNESSTNRASYLSTGQPTYNDCALVIQPLGTSVPVNSKNQALLPDYYLLVKSSSGTIVGLDPIWDGQTFTDLMPGLITASLLNAIGDNNITVSGTQVKDNDIAATFNSSGILQTNGYVPTYSRTYTVPTTAGAYVGDTVTFEPTAHAEFSLPPETSSQCYNPQANGNTASQVTIQDGGGTSQAFAPVGNQNNNGTAINPVANPQLGAIICNSNPPETYALYWNDLGTYGSDDLGYWNAIVAFTCSVPGSSTAGGGPPTLSG
ncbi:MAG: hypothetical protein B7X08_02310 [Acidocella sp. 20-63-7]|nr:MAG: hypothetical protein B7X08_02310 [Acidocella sp. 20-63-7]